MIKHIESRESDSAEYSDITENDSEIFALLIDQRCFSVMLESTIIIVYILVEVKK